MSVHVLFAENLRRKCGEFETIAEVCRGIGINRQQFNKYLAGSAFPNALTLRRICTFLKISEQVLFEPPAPNGTHHRVQSADQDTAASPFGFLVNGTRNFDFDVRELQNGAYYSYCPFPKAPGVLVRSLMLVSGSLGNRSFLRLTGFPSQGRLSVRSLAYGRHAGAVIANQTEIYFLGLNRYSPRQMSLLTVEKANLMGQHFFTGMLLTRSGSGSLNSRICMVRQDTAKSRRELIADIGLVHESDAYIEPIVLAALKETIP
jgi:transcriptional regulator with XRE-family HTH domain